ncbi:MAG: hypothetical protein CL510_10160 [Actinobacteria bacterium]|nr:hypothetical protein [Actinomycetota bacterium]
MAEVEQLAAQRLDEKEKAESEKTLAQIATDSNRELLKSITEPLKQVNEHEKRLLNGMHQLIEDQRNEINALRQRESEQFDTIRELLDGKAEREEFAKTEALKRESITAAMKQLGPLLPELGRQVFKLKGTKEAKKELAESNEMPPEKRLEMLRTLGGDLAEALTIEQCKQLKELADFQGAEKLSETLGLMAEIKETLDHA